MLNLKMQEKKKFMPAITNYLSDNDDDFDEGLQINISAAQSQTNYAEWKQLQKSRPEISNGTKPRIRSDGSLEPLGDISSGDEHYGIDENEPIYKIVTNLSEADVTTRKSLRIKRKPKQPSPFLLFSRMKHLQYQHSNLDLTFNELCRITHNSWENIQQSELEEFNDNMDQRIREYGDVLLKFRSVLLPDSSSKLKYKSWVSAAVARKEQSVSLVTNNIKENVNTIPERLQNLVGKASIYHANASHKLNRNSHQSSYTYRPSVASSNYFSETGLNYVANVIETCKSEHCTNKPVEDCRWDGQYCSAKCLIDDCKETFLSWRADQKEFPVITNGANSSVSHASGDNDEEIMQYLTTNTQELLSDSEESINRDENLFASLQQHYFPKKNIIDITESDSEKETKTVFSNDYFSLKTDIDDDVQISPTKLHHSAQKKVQNDLCRPPSGRYNSAAISSQSEG